MEKELIQMSSRGIRPENQPEPILTALHYLFSHDEGQIVAHCLDLDLATSGSSLEEAEESLNAIVLYQIESCYIAGNFGQLKFKAPIECWQALEGSKHLDTVLLEVEIPPVVLPVTRKVSLPVMRAELAAA
jgi:hypothetical protein